MFSIILNNLLPKNIYFFYFRRLESHLKNMDSVLDLACGKNSPLFYCHKSFFSVGADIFEPYLIQSKEKGIHDDYIVSDVMKISDKVAPKSFDCVVALDLIEHLDKPDGFKLIKIMESIARKKVIIFTPNGFLRQEPYDDNLWQEHKSGWEVDEMKDLGFQVYGQGGLKYLRGERARIKYRPEFFWSRLSYISQKIVEKNPKYSFQLLCVNNLDVDKK